MRSWVIAVGIALSHLGCAEQQLLLDRGPTSGASPCFFWPPPRSSAMWLTPASAKPGESLGTVASRLEAELRGGGYAEQRWYPIGAGYDHGFAITTRLEEIEGAERWSALYPEAASLKWLTQAASPALPRPGRYRAWLISYTDLPAGEAHRAPIWSEETVMDWPNATQGSSARESGLPSRAPAGYRVGVYEYDYEMGEAEGRGARRVASDRVAEASSPPIFDPPAR